MFKIHEFQSEFGQYLRGGTRWEAFQLIARELSTLYRPVTIIETGCVRKEGNWMGDGQSTLIWNWIAKKTFGRSFSVDIDPDAVKIAQSLAPHVKVECSDSIKWLQDSWEVKRADLIFLDSYDFDGSYRSSLHHIGELAVCYERLPSGCMIAVDDCHSGDAGKHVMVAKFFEMLDIPPIHQGYITIWRKP